MSIDSCASTLVNLDNYLAVEGPFDMVLAFSQGAMIAATYIIWKSRQSPDLPLPFKGAVFLSASGAYDPDLLRKGFLRALTPRVDGNLIRIPTAHIWGRGDISSRKASDLSGLCASDTRHIYIHPGGHEIPGARMNGAVRYIVQIIRRVISLANDTDSCWA